MKVEKGVSALRKSVASILADGEAVDKSKMIDASHAEFVKYLEGAKLDKKELDDAALEGMTIITEAKAKIVAATAAPPAADNFEKGASAKELKMFIPITKIDAAKRLVYGVATAELPDLSNEVCDYATTKPLYQKWSDGFAKQTDGKSLGNLRAMHQPISAGKVTQIEYDDSGKKIEICAKVVDDAEWQKVDEGVYSGFSHGGKYIKRWPDPVHKGCMRYTAEPGEISLVDSPCLTEATFQVIKADGSTEMRKFKEPTPWSSDEIIKYAGAGAWKDEAADLPVNFGLGIVALQKVLKPGDPLFAILKDVKADTQLRPVLAKIAELFEDDDSGARVWVHKDLPGRVFKRRPEMMAALEVHQAAELAKKTASPILEALASAQAKIDERIAKAAAASSTEPGQTTTAEPAAEVRSGDPWADKHMTDSVRIAAGVEEAVWKFTKAFFVKLPKHNNIALLKAAFVDSSKPDGTVVMTPELKQAVAQFSDAAASFGEVNPAAAPAVAKSTLSSLPTGTVPKLDEFIKREFTDDKRKQLAGEGKAMKDGSFPIENKGDLKNAIEAFGRAKNKTATKRHIIKRAKALGATDMLPENWSASTKSAGKIAALIGALGTMTKADIRKAASFDLVASLVNVMQSLSYFEDRAESPAWGWDGGVELDRDLTNRFGSLVVELCDIAAEILDAVIDELRETENAEAANQIAASIEIGDLHKAITVALMVKAGAKHSKADKAKIKAAHDTLSDLDPDCCPANDDGAAEKLRKTLAAEREANGKLLNETLLPIVQKMAKQIEDIANTPLPMGTSSVTVDKAADNGHRAETSRWGGIADGLGAAKGQDDLTRLAETALTFSRGMR
jgi:hypothetical protein